MEKLVLAREPRKAWRALFEAHARILAQIDRDLEAAQVGSLSDYDVLFTLYESPHRRLRLAELALAAVLSRSGLTRLIDRLETKGYLRREPDPSDRRGTFAVLTETGIEELRRIWAVYSQGIARYFADPLSEAEVEMVYTLFTRLAARMRCPSAPCD